MALTMLRLTNGDIIVGEKVSSGDTTVEIGNPFKYTITYVGEKASAGFIPYVPFMEDGRTVHANLSAIVYETYVSDELAKFYYEDIRAIFSLFETLREATEQKEEELMEQKKSRLN